MSKLDLKSRLSELEFQVTQNAHTEPPFSGKFFNFFEVGTYKCICCDSVLFDSQDKFKSSTGWASFHSSINDKALKLVEDHSFGMLRIEVVCSNCQAHLGHVFNDGPKPSFKRYCINSASLNFKKNG